MKAEKDNFVKIWIADAVFFKVHKKFPKIRENFRLEKCLISERRK